ncbi:hypothetical protein KC323_g33 [Hortaea werneckii]|nr:hypothetical protein KC323_g33 [Hortaea werneckii]
MVVAERLCPVAERTSFVWSGKCTFKQTPVSYSPNPHRTYPLIEPDEIITVVPSRIRLLLPVQRLAHIPPELDPQHTQGPAPLGLDRKRSFLDGTETFVDFAHRALLPAVLEDFQRDVVQAGEVVGLGAADAAEPALPVAHEDVGDGRGGLVLRRVGGRGVDDAAYGAVGHDVAYAVFAGVVDPAGHEGDSWGRDVRSAWFSRDREFSSHSGRGWEVECGRCWLFVLLLLAIFLEARPASSLPRSQVDLESLEIPAALSSPLLPGCLRHVVSVQGLHPHFSSPPRCHWLLRFLLQASHCGSLAAHLSSLEHRQRSCLVFATLRFAAGAGSSFSDCASPCRSRSRTCRRGHEFSISLLLRWPPARCCWAAHTCDFVLTNLALTLSLLHQAARWHPEFRPGVSPAFELLRVGDDTNRPEINFFVVTFPLLQDLRSKIVRSSAHGRSPFDLHLPLGHKQSRQTKVSNFDIHLVVEKQIARFEIPVDNVAVMEIFDCACNLDNEAPDFGEGQVFPLLEHVGK